MSVDKVVIGLAILDALERETNFTTWSDGQMLPDREDYRAIMMAERVEQFDVFLSCSGFARALCLHNFCHECAALSCR